MCLACNPHGFAVSSKYGSESVVPDLDGSLGLDLHLELSSAVALHPSPAERDVCNSVACEVRLLTHS